MSPELVPAPGESARAIRCLACLARPGPIDRLWFGWSYQEPMTTVIHKLKFGRLSYLGRQLGQRLDTVFGRELEEQLIDAVVPVPLHWRRRLRRGFNQAWEIARPIARAHGWPLEAALGRARPTPPQARRRRAQRSRLPRSTFAVRAGRKIEGRRFLLVDDVVTTGATLEAAAGALERAGSAWIGALVAARTPRLGAPPVASGTESPLDLAREAGLF